MSAGFEPAKVGVNVIFLTNDFRVSNDHHSITISVYQFRHDILLYFIHHCTLIISKNVYFLWDTNNKILCPYYKLKFNPIHRQSQSHPIFQPYHVHDRDRESLQTLFQQRFLPLLCQEIYIYPF